MTSDIGVLAAFAYRNGKDPIDWAIELAEIQIGLRDEVVAGRIENPKSYPSYQLDLSTGAVARRIVGDLLDAGWTPPTGATA